MMLADRVTRLVTTLFGWASNSSTLGTTISAGSFVLALPRPVARDRLAGGCLAVEFLMAGLLLDFCACEGGSRSSDKPFSTLV